MSREELTKFAHHSKIVAMWLALFLGFAGVHRFYLREYGLGLVYLGFCWTGIPAVAGLLDAIGLFRESEDEFLEEHPFLVTLQS